jgi:hypothetical protein
MLVNLRKLCVGALAASFLSLTQVAYAGDAALKTALSEARSTLVDMLKDPAKRTPEQQAAVKKSADAVSEMMAAMKPPAGKEAAFKELSDLWVAFKKTREEELVPLIIAGKQEEADKIGLGIQKERYEKMVAIVDAM